jgi:hypothetical protein
MFNWNKHQLVFPDFEQRFERASKVSQLPSILGVMADFIAIFLAGFLSLHLIPGRLGEMGRSLDNSKFALFRMFFVGVMAFLLIIPAGIILSSSPTSFLFVFVLVIVTYTSGIMGVSGLVFRVGYEVGKRLNPTRDTPLVSLLFGTILFSAVINLPYLGGIIKFLLLVIGVGIVLATRYGSGRSWHIPAIYQEGK